MKCIKIDNYTAKEAMSLVVDYMKLESIQIIEMITLDTLKFYQNDNGTVKKDWSLEDFDITIAENRAVLEAAGITDEKLLKEAEAQLFMKMFMRYLHKNRVKVFLFAENEENLERMRKFFSEHSSGIKIIETATIETHGISDDMILNRINGVEADCILAALPSPLQQDFIMRNRMLINAKLWVGLGNGFLKKTKLEKSWIFQLKDFLTKKITKI